MQSLSKKQIAIYTVIFFSLFLALLPVILSNNYLRQDDMKTGLYWGMRMKDEGYLYYNTFYQLVRPLCMILFFYIDMLSINLHYAVYVRLASIINVGLLGILLYRWQIQFNSNRILAAAFAIAAFTLPGIQLSAATANYFLMIFGILLAFGGPVYWFKSFSANTRSEKKKYLWLGSAIFFASFLDYPMSSMYAWVLMGICYLNSFTPNAMVNAFRRKFFYYGSGLTVAFTGFYFIFMHVFHFVLHVDMTYGRVGTTNIFAILSRMHWIFDVLVAHANLWVFGQTWTSYPIKAIISLLVFALLVNGLKAGFTLQKSLKNTLAGLGVLFILFFMCYSPALATPEDTVSLTMRYTLATMPLLLYAIFWSLYALTTTARSGFLARLPINAVSLAFITTAVASVAYANIMVADGIVGPQTSDYDYIESQLQQKVIPLIQQNRLVAIHVIDCDHGKSYKFANGIPEALEYGMRLCTFPHHLVCAFTHSMMTFGYLSNKHKLNDAYSDENIFVLKEVPWGNIIVSSHPEFELGHVDHPIDQLTVVTIDMRDAPSYQRFDLYKHLLKTHNL
jgi:hypothetical protein